MSVFAEIDEKWRQYQRDLASTRDAVKALGGASVKADSLGFWTCSYRQTKGLRLAVKLKARSPAALIALLEVAPDRPGRVEQRDMDGGSR